MGYSAALSHRKCPNFQHALVSLSLSLTVCLFLNCDPMTILHLQIRITLQFLVRMKARLTAITAMKAKNSDENDIGSP